MHLSLNGMREAQCCVPLMKGSCSCLSCLRSYVHEFGQLLVFEIRSLAEVHLQWEFAEDSCRHVDLIHERRTRTCILC